MITAIVIVGVFTLICAGLSCWSGYEAEKMGDGGLGIGLLAMIFGAVAILSFIVELALLAVKAFR